MKQNESKYTKAKKRVDEIKGFYSHLTVFIVMSILLIILKTEALSFMDADKFGEHFVEWLNMNAYITIGIWAAVILFHGLNTFKFSFFKNWEEKKIQEIMENEEESNKRWS